MDTRSLEYSSCKQYPRHRQSFEVAMCMQDGKDSKLLWQWHCMLAHVSACLYEGAILVADLRCFCSKCFNMSCQRT